MSSKLESSSLDAAMAAFNARSEAMRRLLDVATRAARSEATVLIVGESGTGKERLARFLHERSARRDGPLLALNCGALPENLLESELFGHERGAFTGASARREGLFEAARGGTLFLDEVGETSPAVQVRLLRALQERAVRRVGGRDEVPIDVRVIAATHRDLAALVSAGEFRQDLFFRLRVVPLEVPPLRARREDVLPLARHFIGRSCRLNRCGPCELSDEVQAALLRYDWPGNVRELENAIERAVVLAEGRPHIRLEDLPPEVLGASPELVPGRPAESAEEPWPTLEELERRHVEATLARFGGHRRKTAEALGIAENTLWRRLKKWGILGQERRGRRARRASGSKSRRATTGGKGP